MTSPWTWLSQTGWDATASDADRMINQTQVIDLQDADYSLTETDQYRRRHLAFKGTVTAPRTVYMIAKMQRRMSFENRTNMTLTVCYAGTSDRGSALTIDPGQSLDVQGDGWDVVAVPNQTQASEPGQPSEPAPLSGTFTIPAGELGYQVSDPSITPNSVAMYCATDFWAAQNDIYTHIVQGSVSFWIAGRTVGYCSLNMDERVINLPTSTPVKITDYENTSNNPIILLDNPNGLWVPQTTGVYQIIVEVSFLAPNNSAFTFYLAKNENLQDAITDSITISGGSQNLVWSLSEVAAAWKGGDNMSFWIERTTGGGDVTFYDISILTTQIELLEPQPALQDTRWSYFIWN